MTNMRYGQIYPKADSTPDTPCTLQENSPQLSADQKLITNDQQSIKNDQL